MNDNANCNNYITTAICIQIIIRQLLEMSMLINPFTADPVKVLHFAILV